MEGSIPTRWHARSRRGARSIAAFDRGDRANAAEEAVDVQRLAVRPVGREPGPEAERDEVAAASSTTRRLEVAREGVLHDDAPRVALVPGRAGQAPPASRARRRAGAARARDRPARGRACPRVRPWRRQRSRRAVAEERVAQARHRAASGSSGSEGRHEVISQGPQVAAVVEFQELRPEGRHVHLDRAGARAGLAGEAAVHRLLHRMGEVVPSSQRRARRRAARSPPVAGSRRAAAPASAADRALAPRARRSHSRISGRGPWANAGAPACPSRTGTWRRPHRS